MKILIEAKMEQLLKILFLLTSLFSLILTNNRLNQIKKVLNHIQFYKFLEDKSIEYSDYECYRNCKVNREILFSCSTLLRTSDITDDNCYECRPKYFSSN